MSERTHSIILPVLGAAVAFGTMVLVSAVWAHDKHHPELSAWFKSLANSHGTPCCDGSDATRIEDVDWQTVCEAGTGECHYQVRLEAKWWDVPPTAVVQSGNRVGPALVWPVYYGDHDKIAVLIRCFIARCGRLGIRGPTAFNMQASRYGGQRSPHGSVYVDSSERTSSPVS